MYALFTMYCSWQNSAYKSLPSIIHLSFEYSCCSFEKEHMVRKYLFACHCWFWQLQQRIAAVSIEYFNPTGTNYVLRHVTYLFQAAFPLGGCSVAATKGIASDDFSMEASDASGVIKET